MRDAERGLCRSSSHLEVVSPRASDGAASEAQAPRALLGGGKGKALVNLSKAMIGTGLLALPHVMSETGLLAGAGLLALSLTLAGYSMNLVLLSYVRIADRLEEHTPTTVAVLAEVLCGLGWRRLVEALTVLVQLCFCVAYVYVVLDTAEEVLHSARWLAACCLLPVVGLLSTIGSLRNLWWVSALGLVSFVFGVMGGTLVQGAAEGRHLSFVQGNSQQQARLTAWFGWWGSFLYSAEAVNHIVPNATSLDRPREMSGVLAVSFCLYFALAGTWQVLVTAMGFGSCPGRSDTVLECLTPGVLSDTIRVAVAVNLVLTLPISLYPAVQMVEAWCGPRDAAEGANRLARACRTLLRPLAAWAVVGLGLKVKSLKAFTGFVGSTVMVVLGFIVPVRLYSAAVATSGERCRRQRLLLLPHGLLVVLALLLASVETFTKVGLL